MDSCRKNNMIAVAKMLRKLLESYLNRVSVLYFATWDVRFTARNIHPTP